MLELKTVERDHPPPMLLLRGVRDVMKGSGAVQERLDKLVTLIAEQFDSEVCSIYLLQPGHVLELYATAGLNPSAAHVTRLSVGQGLVGHIAAEGAVLNLDEASKHPAFVYRPETGEETFHSFIGVPILSGMQVIGVLVVQSVAAHSYSEEQVEVLETVAMVLAELISGQKLVDRFALARDKRNTSHAHAISGQKICPGLAKAEAVLHRPRIEITEVVSDDSEAEAARLKQALEEMRSSVETLIATSGIAGTGEQADILETYRMFTYDRGWEESMHQAIQTGLTAEAAVKKVFEELHMRLEKITSPHIRQRIEDLEDISMRLLYHLTGISHTAAHSVLPDAFILVARSMGPAELLEYGTERIKGVVLERGSAASHIAIIARMLDIPVVSGITNAREIILPGDQVIVDGDNGQIYVRPGDDLSEEVNRHLAFRQKQSATYAAQRELPAVTLDGVRVMLNLNIGLHLGANQVASPDVDGIGLFRTELPYLTSNAFPEVEDQRRVYADIFDKAQGKPIVFRSFDVGGDKSVPYIHMPDEENPAMGWRATRIGLDRPVILRHQFRALLEAAAGRPLTLMFPMIATVEEFEMARQILDKEVEALAEAGLPAPSTLKVGVMLEIPSLIFALPALLPKINFISIGSNDLMQFFFAADRGNELVATRYDPLRPSVLGMIRQITEQCHTAGVDVGFCGNLASTPIDLIALLACGVRSISVPPPAIGSIKAVIRSLNLQQATQYVDVLCGREERSIRPFLKAYARDHQVDTGYGQNG